MARDVYGDNDWRVTLKLKWLSNNQEPIGERLQWTENGRMNMCGKNVVLFKNNSSKNICLLKTNTGHKYSGFL